MKKRSLLKLGLAAAAFAALAAWGYYEAMKRARDKLKIPKARPSRPIQWDSAKQKRAFFATDGFGRGIPSVRTNASLRWDITATGNGYMLYNPTGYASRLYGHYDGGGQSRIFEGTYPLFVEMVEHEVEGLPEDIEEHITYYARGKGF